MSHPLVKQRDGLIFSLMRETEFIIPLHSRKIFCVEGGDAAAFLQGLLTVDIAKMEPGSLRYALMLSPQGKFLHDGFVNALNAQHFRIDTEASQCAGFIERLQRYKLRSKVEITEIDAQVAFLSRGIAVPEHIFKAEDPRMPELGCRLASSPSAMREWLGAHSHYLQPEYAYALLRYRYGVPEGGDLIPDKSFPLEYGLDQLHGVDYTKGCYVGQEVTARTHYRGVIRKFIHTVKSAEPLPTAAGTKVTAGGKEIGEIRAAVKDQGLALLRLQEVAEARAAQLPLMADETVLEAELPHWARISIASGEKGANIAQE